MVVTFSLDILGLLPVLCFRNTYLYQQNVLGMFPRMAEQLYGPRSWLAEEALELQPNPLGNYDQN